MFQTRTGQISAILFSLALSALPMTATANAPVAPTAQSQFKQAEFAFDELRFETKAKISETQKWVDVQTAKLDNLENAADKLQDRLSPARWELKTYLKTKLPETNIIHHGDRVFSVYGLILMMSFALVILLMGLSTPVSRLGGRH